MTVESNMVKDVLKAIQSVVGQRDVSLHEPSFKGNEWTSNNLQKKGYVFDCSIEAKNTNEAVALAHTQETQREQ